MIRSKLALTLLAAGVAISAKPDDRDGLVLGVVGVWKEAGGQPIHFGSVLDDKTDVVCNGSGSLTILLSTAGRPVTLPCESAGAHTNIKELREQNSRGAVSEAFARFLEVIKIQITHEPRTYISAVSRGFGNIELEESVLTLRGSQIDLGPALAGAPAGRYSIAFLPTTESVSDAPPVSIEWTPGKPAPANAPAGLSEPGVIKLAMAAADGTLSGSAWAQIAPPERFEKTAAQFREARDLVSQWPGGVRAQASRTVLRAYLQALANGSVR